MTYITLDLDRHYYLAGNFLPLTKKQESNFDIVMINKIPYIKNKDLNYEVCSSSLCYDEKTKFYKMTENRYLAIDDTNCFYSLIEISADKKIKVIKSFCKIINHISKYVYECKGTCLGSDRGLYLFDCENLTEQFIFHYQLVDQRLNHYTIKNNQISFDVEIFKRDMRNKYPENYLLKNLKLYNYIRYKLLLLKGISENLAKKVLSYENRPREMFCGKILIKVNFTDVTTEIEKSELQSLYSVLINEQFPATEIYLNTTFEEYQNQSLEFLDYIQSDLICEKLDNILHQ